MPNGDFGNAPDNRILGQPGIPVTTRNKFSPESLDSPVAINREVQRLYSWLGLLTGLSILAIGLLAGYAFWLKLQQDQLQRQLAVVNADAATGRFNNNLESQINSLDSQTSLLNLNLEQLNQQVSKGLPTQIQGVQKDISAIKTSLQKFEANAVTRQQMAQIQRSGKKAHHP